MSASTANGQDANGQHDTRVFDVRLLGQVRVTTTDGMSIDLGGPKPKAALVRLALRAGEAVSTDNLVDTLWGDDPPPTARRSLQAHIAKLRAVLGAGDGPLRSRGAGYVLDVPRDWIDVLRIEDGLRAARSIASTDPVFASDLVARCRRDWTGSPFEDLADPETLTGEREHLLRLRDELADLEADLCFVSGGAASSVVQLERAVVEDPIHEPHWVRLITAYYASGRQRDALVAYQRASRTLRDQLGVDPSPQLQRLELQVLRQEIPVGGGEACPYKGLVSYQIADGAIFHGRSDTTDELVNLVLGTPVGVVVGPSGVGKSSVVRAGLCHRVLNGMVPGLLTVSVITPGPRPLRSLFAAGLADLLVVDQFEELFTLTDDLRRREEFVEELVSLAGSSRSRVVIAVRADFYERCMSLTALSRILGRHQVNVGAMSPAGLREAVLGPAEQAGLDIEPALLDTLVCEVSDRPGALPLLSHALSETWRRRSGSTLTIDAYRKAGSIAGAISATAERLYTALDDNGKLQIERLFMRLVEPDSRTAHTRRAASVDELVAAGIDTDLIDRLVAVRLLSVTSDDVEIAHEALISAWPRLTEWIDSEHDNIVAQRRLTRAAEAWLASGKDEADLYRGNKLSAALTWQAETAPVLAPSETEFLRVSAERAQGELARQRWTNRRLRVLAGTSVMAMIAALSATFVAVGRSRDADQRREQVEINQLAGVFAGDESLSQADRLRTAAALHTRTPTVDTASFLLDSILTTPSVIARSNIAIFALTGSAPTYASGMATLAIDNNARTVIVDLTTLEFDRSARRFTPAAIAARAAGRLAVDDTTYEVIELPGGRSIGPAPTLDGEPVSVALSSDGTTLALGYSAGAGAVDPRSWIDMIDVASGSSIGQIETTASTVDELELTSDGSKLIGVFDDVGFELWDVGSGERLVRTGVDSDAPAVTSSAFNRIGDAVAVGRGDGTVEIWRETDGAWRLLTAARRHAGAVTWIEFDGVGSLVVSSSRDGSVTLTDASNGALRGGPVTFEGTGSLASFFEPATGDLVTIDSLGRTWRWSATPGFGLVTMIGVASTSPPPFDEHAWVGVAGGAAVTVDGTSVSDLGVGQGGAEVIDVVTGRSGDYVIVFPDRIEWHRPTGETVLTIEADGNALDGRVTVNAQVIAYVVPQPENDEPSRILVVADDGATLDEIEIPDVRGDVTRLDLSPTGDDLVYSSERGELIWYSLTTLDAGVLLPAGAGRDGRFTSDGLVAAVGINGAQLIDLDDGQTVVDVGIGRDAVGVAFESSMGIAATSDETGNITLWDVESGRQIGPRLSPLGGERPRWIAFDAEGRLVVGGGARSAVVSLNDTHWLSQACSLAETLDPDKGLPSDPRLRKFTACP